MWFLWRSRALNPWLQKWKTRNPPCLKSKGKRVIGSPRQSRLPYAIDCRENRNDSIKGQGTPLGCVLREMQKRAAACDNFKREVASSHRVSALNGSANATRCINNLTMASLMHIVYLGNLTSHLLLDILITAATSIQLLSDINLLWYRLSHMSTSFLYFDN